jgi:hypothetical protein
MSQAKNWTFTLNNHTEDDILRLERLVDVDRRVKYIIFGREVGENGTPHLQGFVSLNVKLRMTVVKALLGSNPHMEIARNVPASIIYCKKDGNFSEYGEIPGNRGQRNDLEEFKTAVKGGMLSLKDIRATHSEVYAKYTRFCLEFISDNYPMATLEEHDLRPWQERLMRKLEEPADRRKIIFIVDETGNSGKSWFAHWFCNKIGEACQVMLPGKKADMAYALKPGLKCLFLDAPRSKQGEFIQYDFLEDLKNGYVFSTKYESRIKSYEPMHVVVNMNEAPDREKLSADRYDVINLRSL